MVNFFVSVCLYIGFFIHIRAVALNEEHESSLLPNRQTGRYYLSHRRYSLYKSNYTDREPLLWKIMLIIIYNTSSSFKKELSFSGAVSSWSPMFLPSPHNDGCCFPPVLASLFPGLILHLGSSVCQLGRISLHRSRYQLSSLLHCDVGSRARTRIYPADFWTVWNSSSE